MTRRHRIDDSAAEALLSGASPADRDDLSGLASSIRRVREGAASQVAPVMAQSVREASVAPVLDEMDHVPALPEAWVTPRRGRIRPITALGAVLGTVTGKIVVGTAIAAASVGGLHAASVVDVPGLPDEANAEADANHPGTEVDVPTDGADASGHHEDAGVDGDGVSDRAVDGDPQDDGEEFGTSVATEATDGTPAEGTVGTTGGDAATTDAPAGPETGSDYAEDAPYDDSAPAGPETGEEYAEAGPEANPTDRP